MTAKFCDYNKMLFCPKCQQNFDKSVGRFCPNDNARLLPAPATDKSTGQTGGVFSNVLNRNADNESGKFQSIPRFSQSDPTFSRLTFRPPPSKVFKSEDAFELDLELDLPAEVESEISVQESETESVKLIEENIEQTEIEVEQIEEPSAAPPDLTASDDFIGETLNNRFRIVEQISSDENGVSYLAEESDEKFIVKILNIDDKFADQIFAEERIALAQINHPNIARVADSGELPDGSPYLVTERVEGATVKDFLNENGRFDALRTARIVRQTADALGAAHQKGILHRNLKPENICLVADENGIERVKLTGFGAAKERLDKNNLLYKSPEQVEGRIANFTSDGFSLAVIAYQMLTGQLPFNAASVGDLLKAQREGIKVSASDLRDDLPATIDAILAKALAFNSFDRYENVQDFGDEYFGEIIANSPLEDDEEEIVETVSDKFEEPVIKEKAAIIAPIVPTDVYLPAVRETPLTDGGVKATEDLAWEKRSPEMPNEPSPRRNVISILGVAGLLIALLGVWYYFINRPSENFVSVPPETTNQNVAPIINPTITETNTNSAPTPEEVEAPPLPRSIKQPPETVYFQNTKAELTGDLMKNFLGFSLYYPKDWRRNEAPKNFLDISKNSADGLPIEQMLVTFYNSKGTFKSDAEIFPAQVKETNKSLEKILPDYQMISEGKKTVNNGWQAYEVQFQGTGKTSDGKEIQIWGKRLFIPTAVRGMKNGYVVTMLATSLSSEVKSVEDVGIKGELSSVLETFEPNQNF